MRNSKRPFGGADRNPAADTSALEREFDELVDDLYGLTKEERAIVEAATRPKRGK